MSRTVPHSECCCREGPRVSGVTALDERARNARGRPDYPTEPILSEAEWQALRGMCKGAARGQAKKPADDKGSPPKDAEKR